MFFVVGLLVVVAVTDVGNEGVSQNALNLQAYRNSCRVRVSGSRMISRRLSLRSQSSTDRRRLCGPVCGQFALLAGHPGHPSAIRETNKDSSMY